MGLQKGGPQAELRERPHMFLKGIFTSRVKVRTQHHFCANPDQGDAIEFIFTGRLYPLFSVS